MTGFEAAAAAQGYLYQVRYSLVQAVEAWLEGSLGWRIGIETADDVEIVDSAGQHLVQLKHTQAALSTGSEALWKSLRIWATQVENGEGISSATFFLITTGDVTEGSAPYLLHPPESGRRSPQQALSLLIEFASHSENKGLKAAFDAFLGLPDDQQLTLLEKVVVLAGESDVSELGRRLQRRVALGLGKAHGTAFVESLEGWWLNRVIDALAVDPASRPMITAEEFDAFVTDLHADLVGDWLPINENVAGLAEVPDDYSDFVFVKQLDLIDAGEKTIFRAVRDYYRAYWHQSEWQRLQLISGPQASKYERILVEAWRVRFEYMCDDLGAEQAEEKMCELARALYKWVETADHPRIRGRVDDPFIAKGSFQMLADARKVGWHPDFEARLVALLEPLHG